jgi:hypothetical protein
MENNNFPYEKSLNLQLPFASMGLQENMYQYPLQQMQ